MIRLYIPIYALTLLISATLLFSIQPMFSKMILPLLGGTPQVWNTAMLFFQVCLLGGYAYAHGTSRILSPRIQAILHIVLLVVFVGVLPFAIPEGWSPPVDRDPTLWQLSLMAVTVGGPFFVLAGSAPMIQRWFSRTDHPDADNPYFLYGASNLGSMTGLLAYPVIVEPLMNLTIQFDTWMYGYFALIAFMVLSLLLLWKHGGAKPKNETVDTPVNDSIGIKEVTWGLRFKWILLAFIPSSLMLGVTTFITTDIASVPLLWIMPLAIYVSTFIFVFARRPWFSEKFLNSAFAIILIVMIGQILGTYFGVINPFLLIALHLVLFFVAAMLCHTALANVRPTADRLTEFYLIMSIGGALGGVFNAIIAPQLLLLPIEYALVLVLCIFVRYHDDPEQTFKAVTGRMSKAFKAQGVDAAFTSKGFYLLIVGIVGLFAFGIPSEILLKLSALVLILPLLFLYKDRWLFGVSLAYLLALFPLGFEWGQHSFTDIIHRDRNFFGVIKVVNTKNKERILLHGTTNHGSQALEEKYKLTPLSYYSDDSPIKEVFEFYDDKDGDQQVGVLGLGIGVTACFTKDGREFDFYEIDAAVAEIAENREYFTFLKDCGSPYEIILGDGRLKIENKPDDYYDVIVGDAFSSDNIPVHIMTKEAIELYVSKLKANGAVTFNISNNYIDLEPVVTEIAEEIGIPAVGHISDGGTLEGSEIRYYPAHFFTMSYNEELIENLKSRGWTEGIKREGVKAWTDQYSNIISVLNNHTAFKRYSMQDKETAENEGEEPAETENEEDAIEEESDSSGSGTPEVSIDEP